MSPLSGRVALVTGGSRGIGAAIARRLAADGADVAVTYRNSPERAAEVAAGIRAAGRRATAIAADSADAGAIRHAVETAAAELGRLDVLVNNAGTFPYGPLADVTIEELDATLAVHPRAAFVAAQAAAPLMTDGGRIVSIGSNLAVRAGAPNMTLYAMSKAALDGLTRGLAHDLADRGITANTVHPGNTATDMNPPDDPGADEARAETPLGRYADPAEIAATVAHLASAGGAFISGASITVDGGRNA